MDNIRVKQESLNNWRSEFEIEEGLVTTGLALSGAGALAAWALPKLKKNVDKKLEDASNNMTIGGEYRKKQIEKKTGVKLEQTSNWRDEFHPTEIESIDIIKAEPLVERDVYVKSNRNPNTGIPIGLKSGGIKDAGTDPVDVMKKMILGDKAEVNKKKETVAASYEIDVENIMLEFVEEDINLLYEN